MADGHGDQGTAGKRARRGRGASTRGRGNPDPLIDRENDDPAVDLAEWETLIIWAVQYWRRRGDGLFDEGGGAA